MALIDDEENVRIERMDSDEVSSRIRDIFVAWNFSRGNDHLSAHQNWLRQFTWMNDVVAEMKRLDNVCALQMEMILSLKAQIMELQEKRGK